MKVCITGGAGFIGRHLVHHLALAGHDVTVIDRQAFRPYRQLTQPSRVVIADLNDKALASQLAGTDVIYHLAATSRVMPYESDPLGGMRDNVTGHVALLQAAVESGVKKVVFASSREVYGEALTLPVNESHVCNPSNHYGMSKYYGECMLDLYSRVHGLEYTAVRLANVYGEGDRQRVIPTMTERAKRGDELVVSGEHKVIDFVFVGAVVEQLGVLGAVGAFSGERVNLGSGKGTTLLELAKRIRSVTSSGSNISTREPHDREVRRYVADVSRLHHLTGYQPPSDPLYALADVVAAQGEA